ncbi:hypothetical protein [Kitasatospora sp. A2-31]|uniref:hypothetical protein n=1 Tax=Kitasatospora sp. A2-31 TaxID=2916414 RepID=UPI001EE7D911|nr:hypothetical protein [Kitasatospora sp. A2-31]MCG6493378.1 hypothetical protein [Kitasatospora sp. A2-31]
MAYAEKVYKVRNGKPTKQYTWRCRYKLPDGSTGSEPGFPTKKTAEDWGNEQEAAIRAGRWLDPSLARKPFGEWAREWMAAKEPRGRTRTTRWDRLDAHILPRWENVPLNAITWFDAENWANNLECHDVTATQCLTLMSQIMTGAVDANYLQANPLFGRRRSRSAAAKAAVPKRDSGELWAPPEVVLRMARRVGPRDGMHILTTAFSGLRWGESLGLHRDDVLRERRIPHRGKWWTCPILRVHQEVAEYQTRSADGSKGPMVLDIEPLKNEHSARDIDVPPFLAELLVVHLDAVKHPFAFMTKDGQHWRRGNFGRQVVRPAADGRTALAASKGHAPREAWEPIMPGLTMRALRHTHDTYQAEIGVKPVLAYEQAGHRYPGIKGTYQHATPEMRQERLEGLQQIYERGMAALGWDRVWETS